MSKKKKLDLEEFKKEYVGKTINWLTVLDVIRKDGRIDFMCSCKCGKIHAAYYRRILSGNTKSCGCYHHSKEKAGLYTKWCKNNPDKVKAATEKRKQYYRDNPEKLAEQGRRHSQYYKDNSDVGKIAGEKYSRWCKDNPSEVKKKTEARSKTLRENPDIQLNINRKLSKYYEDHPDRVRSITESNINRHKEVRVSSDCSELIKVLHPDYIEPLMKGEIQSDSKIRTRCPICNEYAEHTFNNVYRLHKANFRNGSPPVCSKCKNACNSSKAEQEIADYISTFYNGKCVRNSREIISPLELDLYYPEKKIAIEFNGDYWHSSEFKDKDYHYNKFRECRDNGVLLVSVFESDWNNRRDEIREYMKDLFNGIENKLSYNDDYSLMNNNYPSPLCYNLQYDYVESSYIIVDSIVFTCGYSKMLIDIN